MIPKVNNGLNSSRFEIPNVKVSSKHYHQLQIRPSLPLLVSPSRHWIGLDERRKNLDRSGARAQIRVKRRRQTDRQKGGLKAIDSISHPEFLALKHESRILGHISNPACGFSAMEQVRLCAVWPVENWLGSSLNQIEGWTTV